VEESGPMKSVGWGGVTATLTITVWTLNPVFLLSASSQLHCTKDRIEMTYNDTTPSCNVIFAKFQAPPTLFKALGWILIIL